MKSSQTLSFCFLNLLTTLSEDLLCNSYWILRERRFLLNWFTSVCRYACPDNWESQHTRLSFRDDCSDAGSSLGYITAFGPNANFIPPERKCKVAGRVTLLMHHCAVMGWGEKGNFLAHNLSTFSDKRPIPELPGAACTYWHTYSPSSLICMSKKTCHELVPNKFFLSSQ